MQGFRIRAAANHTTIRFQFHLDAAPITCQAFEKLLPFARTLMHARLSGQEIWTDQAPALDIIQENASVFAEPGEVVFGPSRPARVKTANCIGIYYGEGRGLDACNIFAKVMEGDIAALRDLGDLIWKQGEKEIYFERLD